MADATRFQVKSKQIDEHKQATDASATQMEKLTQSQAQIDKLVQSQQKMVAMMAALMSQSSGQLGRPPDPQYSASGDLTSYSQAPQPPDPPDIRKSRQDLTIKAPDPSDFNQSELISAIQIPNKLTLRYSCEEIYERMENGFCIFCEDLDTPGHYHLKHKRSKLCLVECVDDELPDAELVEPTVEEISNKSVNVIQDEESNPENESRSEVLISQFQVPLSSMEPSRRCCNDSLDVVDECMCNELVCDGDGDSINTMSAKFHEIYEEPQFELMCLKQSHDPVEIHLDNFESALTRSSLRHTPTYQYRAPFNPYQNFNDQCHYKREFGKHTEPGIEFDRASEEVEDDELQDKQPEDDNSMVENQKNLARKIEIPVFESLHEPSRLFDEESKGTLGNHTLAPMKPYQSYSQSWYELDTTQSDINFKVLVARECDMVSVVVIYEVATTFEKLSKTWKFKFKSNPRRSKLLGDMFSLMENSSEKYVMVWAERENETIKKSFKGLSKVEKDHKIEATVLVFLRHIFGIEHKITSGWIKDPEQGAKYEWSLFLQALQAVKDHKKTNYVTNTAILGVKGKHDPHGRLKEDMSLGSLTQKHHNKWGILTGTEIFSYNGVIIQVMVQRQWETFVMMLLSTAESLILLSDLFIFAEKKGIEISISCCYGTSSVVMQFSTAFEIMSKQQRFIQLPNLPRESSHDDADRILQKREEHITSSARNVAVTKALIQWKEHPPDQIKDSQMYVLVSENQCQDYSPLLFLERVKDSFEFMLRVEHFENPLVSILTQEVFHLQRPPEISTKCSSPNILNFILEDKDVLKREVL